MVRKPGSKHSVASSRVTARQNDWNSIRDLHQGPRSMAAVRGRIHDRSPIHLPKHKKALADRGPSIHDASDRAPRGRELSVREDLTRIIVDWSGSWQAARPGNWLGRSPATKAALGC